MEKGIALLTAVAIAGFILIAATGGYILSQQRVMNTDLGFQGAYEQDGILHISVKNTGSRAWNTTEFKDLYTPPHGVERKNFTALKQDKPDLVAGNNTCFGRGENVKPGERYSCTTGIKFPGPGDTVEIRIRLAGSSKVWTYECTPRTSNAVSC